MSQTAFIAMRVEGGADIEARLGAMREDVARRSWAKALRKGAQVIAKEIKVRAPRGTAPVALARQKDPKNRYKRLADSIGVSASARGLQPKASAKARAYWARFVEYGTKAHPSRMTKKSRYGPGRQKRGHAATQAHPFMRPAMDAKRQEAVDAIRRDIMASLEYIGGNRVRNRTSAAGSGDGVSGGGVQGRDSRGRFTTKTPGGVQGRDSRGRFTGLQ